MIEQLHQEPINVIEQQQSYFERKRFYDLICKSDQFDECYRDYLEQNLSIGFGQLYDASDEKSEFSKPSLVILSPTLDIDELEIANLTEKLMSFLENMKQYRKRYAIVHVDDNSYIIGGYIFDPINKLRKSPENDYKYNSTNDILQPIVSLPNMAVSFGIAADEKYIVLIGGHSHLNEPLSQCYIMEIKKVPETWLSLPNLPLPTSGPGVGMIDGEIHVIGGFDILSCESITHGEYYRLKWPIDTQWTKESSIEPVRARSLIVLIPNEVVPFGRFIYVAGGYDVNVKRRPVVIPTVHMYDEEEKNWKLITSIPNLQLIHGLSFYDDKLHVSRSVLNIDNQYNSEIIRSYNLKTNQWIESSK
ncbi:unnamed protein product [Rotaria socialis]|uniref:Uncharacterized protein n=4 Tax=Rotaria socialis TaxID=392032 RepID=A0A817UD30_9BILA|nr:unnamed protein product [Rotaria socialis]CAF3397512.1 unnamed protein product [Rotaria socialis]CAF3493719.1 unnamed protein product [Rotaria socialis]CAF3566543.1 unnamed protein product [Rotaria socialis]CAF4296225.1 unnamed protein product [Rotaria socialis]